MFDTLQTGSVHFPARIYDGIDETIGHTPLVALNRMAKQRGFVGRILAKVEYMNPAGSVKDRPAAAMLHRLMASPDFTARTELIEATSGNNGVACAWLCALYGIPLTIVIPEHMSVERQQLIRLYGAKLVTTPKSLGTKGAIDEAARRVAANPHALSLDQFANPANPEAHIQTTAQELLHDTQGNIDVLVAGVGTGGTISGLAEALKPSCPWLEVVAVEPARCPVLSEGRAGVHNIQGLSSGHVPKVLNQQCYHRVLTVDDDEAIAEARALARTEGLAVGISSGATFAVAARLAADERYRNKHIVIILADSAQRYFSTPLFASEASS
ncbi:cysteine synthase [Alteromonas sp. ASW11-19]|uniref:cysteine synthase n=1 Tax=Alteromonas salexigens TaxID=2982530 RepID=A0ABT2VMF8_9ALTE|nr:cysteine synthase [Alteromonas salexigens]MCU7554497.1 cysteine synthase [Alteromonas salexigens]